MQHVKKKLHKNVVDVTRLQTAKTVYSSSHHIYFNSVTFLYSTETFGRYNKSFHNLAFS